MTVQEARAVAVAPDDFAQKMAAAFAELRHRPEAQQIHPLAADSLDAFLRRGVPQGEEWRFTDLGPLTSRRWRTAPPDPARAAAAAAALPPGPRVVFVNGALAPELSQVPAGVAVTPAAAPPPDEDAFAALNAAFAAGTAVRVAPGRDAGPLALVFVTTGELAMAHPRTVIELGEGSAASILEAHVGSAGEATFTNAVTAVRLAGGARLEHCLLEEVGAAAVLRARVDFTLGPQSRLGSTVATFGGGLVRNDLRATLAGPGADCRLDGLYLVAGEEHVDNHTVIDHAAPHGRSRELYKGILDGKARAVFDGKVLVAPGALKTDSDQANHNLLLSDEAVVNSKPQFNINADDVKCIHGAAIGQLREDEIFYLRTRGLTRRQARALLLQAFASEALARVAGAALREHLEARVQGFFHGAARLEEAA